MNSPIGRARLGRWILTALIVAAAVLELGCPRGAPAKASAFRVGSREELIGGRRALGDVGDYKLSNGVVQAIVQDIGYSRGFGVFGGSLIDVDLVRGGVTSAERGGAGDDYFTEMFPAFFLQAIAPTQVEVANDGADGEAAVIRVTGEGGEFISATRTIDEALIRTKLDYQVEYRLAPGKRYLEIVTTVTNPDKVKAAQFMLDIPFGFVTLMGEGQRLFIPGKAGFDIRYRLDDVYKQKAALNAFPGEVTTLVATEGNGVSYGIAANEEGAGYLQGKPEYYPTAQKDSMLVPMAYGTILAAFWGKPPATLAPGRSYQYTGYVAVGTGDVASVQEVVYELKDQKAGLGRIAGRVREDVTLTAMKDTVVVLQNDSGDYVSSARTRPDGTFNALLPPGRYRAIAEDSVRGTVRSAEALEDYVAVEAGGTSRFDLVLPRPALLSAVVVDETGRPLPSKISVEGIYDYDPKGQVRLFLFDLKVGERTRKTDFVPDDPNDPSTRRYLEAVFFAPDGRGGRAIRPGHYTVYASRGPEYDLAATEVDLLPGKSTEVRLKLTHLMNTPGYLSADLHVHCQNSIDSDMKYDERVASYAAEGVDFLASTDHNYVTDLGPTVQALRLSDWLKTTVGLEVTTLEMGHFNAYPLEFQPGPMTHGSFAWFKHAPDVLFSQMRALGKFGEENTIVQVNHPRSDLQGYFSAFNISAYTGEPMPESGGFFNLDRKSQADGSESPYALSKMSWDFDVLEVFNGRHIEFLRNYRVKDPGVGADPTEPISPEGTVLEQKIKVPTPTDPNAFQIEPVYPGVLDDFYTLTAKGHRFTAVGNSDSHGKSSEAGLPRTYIYMGDVADGSMKAVTEQALVAGLRGRRAIVTDGPFIELWVNDQPIGSTVVSPDGKIRVRVKVQAVPWVQVNRVEIRRGGSGQTKEADVLKTITLEKTSDLVKLDEEYEFVVPDGSFITAEVTGDKSMWPVFTPEEEPPLILTDAIGSIASAFGFADKWGRFKPVQQHVITPFAFTNPIWVDRVARSPLVEKRRAVVTAGPLGGEPRASLPNLLKIFGALHGESGE